MHMSRHHPRCKGPRRCTLGWYSAEIVRARRWRVGDLIEGLVEDNHVAVLRITAVGEYEILAEALTSANYTGESTWYLASRCWVRHE